MLCSGWIRHDFLCFGSDTRCSSFSLDGSHTKWLIFCSGRIRRTFFDNELGLDQTNIDRNCAWDGSDTYLSTFCLGCIWIDFAPQKRTKSCVYNGKRLIKCVTLRLKSNAELTFVISTINPVLYNKKRIFVSYFCMPWINLNIVQLYCVAVVDCKIENEIEIGIEISCFSSCNMDKLCYFTRK